MTPNPAPIRQSNPDEDKEQLRKHSLAGTHMACAAAAADGESRKRSTKRV